MEEALGRVTSRELTELQLFAETEPFGEERADWRAAVALAFHANLHRDRQQRSQPYRPENFLHDFSFERRWRAGELATAPPSAEAQIARLDQWAGVMDAAVASRHPGG